MPTLRDIGLILRSLLVRHVAARRANAPVAPAIPTNHQELTDAGSSLVHDDDLVQRLRLCLQDGGVEI